MDKKSKTWRKLQEIIEPDQPQEYNKWDISLNLWKAVKNV